MPRFSTPDVRAYMGLIRLMAGLDMQFSEDEGDTLERIAAEIGPETFWQHMQASYNSELSADEVWKAAESVTEQEIQEVIYGNLYELSMAGGIEPEEENMLERLAEMWDLQVTQMDPPEGDE